MDRNLIIIAAVAAFALIAFLVLKADESELKGFLTSLGVAYLIGLGVVYMVPHWLNPTIIAAWLAVIPVAVTCGMIARIPPKAKPEPPPPPPPPAPPPPPPKTADHVKQEVKDFLDKRYK